MLDVSLQHAELRKATERLSPETQRAKPRVQVMHRIKVGKGYKTIRTCIV
jgi:hypothetical protein